MARRATAIARLKEQHEHLLLLDSGESLFRGGNSVESDNPEQGALIVAAMNAMGYEAMALGGRDLDAPFSTVRGRFGEADFSVLSANARTGGSGDGGGLPSVRPYLLRQVGKHTVAIIGATSEKAEPRLESFGFDPLQDVVMHRRLPFGL